MATATDTLRRPLGDSSVCSTKLEENDAPRIAVLIPCYNEEITIGKVIDDFRRVLPAAEIIVFDNNSQDATASIARARKTRVLAEPRQGKGFVIESMFDRVDADVYVMIDGDDTYPVDRVHILMEPVLSGRADMVVGARLSTYEAQSFRPLHVFGNNLVRGLVNWIFGTKLTDILSGYRVFNARVAKRLPVVSAGFEVETEMTAQMLANRLVIKEIQVPYGERPEGSFSKLHTFRDGFRVLWTIFSLLRSFKPLTFFGGVGLMLLGGGMIAGAGPVADYLEHRYVYRVPMAILATGLCLLSAGCLFLGILLHAINWRFRELHNVMIRGRGL